MPEFISYADFGRRFFETAVTEQRLASAVASLSDRPISVGPIGVGPVGLVKVRADGSVQQPVLEPRADDEHVAFDLTIPVELKIVIEIGFDKHRFDAEVEIHLALTARPAAPLSVVIDIEEPSRQNVRVRLHADGLRASVVQVLGNVEWELRRQVARFVRAEIAKPAIQEKTVIDVERALHGLG